jgi:quercetin dioxygenase-like cupin family protein
LASHGEEPTREEPTMAEDEGTGAAGAGEEAAGPDELARAETEAAAPHFVEIWNDYDPSQKFAVIFPVNESMGATSSSAAYYIIEPGRHTGVHSDNAEEIVFVTEGEGEVFMLGRVGQLEAGKFIVFPPAVEHDIYAHGGVALRLLSFYPVPEMVTTFQQTIFPMGSTTLSSRPPQAPVELAEDAVPEDFPFDLGELEGESQARDATLTERLIGSPAAGGEEPAAPAEPGAEPEAEEEEEGGAP